MRRKKVEKAWTEPWWDGLANCLAALSALPAAEERLAWLNREALHRQCRNARGLPIRFRDAHAWKTSRGENMRRALHDARVGAGDGAREGTAWLPETARLQGAGSCYEAGIDASGEVPTRTSGEGAWHDLFNALMWLHWPLSKAQLNRLHVCAPALPPGQAGVRGPVRDRATLIDENGMIWVETDRELCQWLRERRWADLFIAGRARWPQPLHILGHALLHKLMKPFKAITAHVWILQPCASAAGQSAAGPGSDRAQADRLLASALAALADPRDAEGGSPGDHCHVTFHPLPVLGIPGWWAANDSPAFYDDEAVFRAPGARARQG